MRLYGPALMLDVCRVSGHRGHCFIRLNELKEGHCSAVIQLQNKWPSLREGERVCVCRAQLFMNTVSCLVNLLSYRFSLEPAMPFGPLAARLHFNVRRNRTFIIQLQIPTVQ